MKAITVSLVTFLIVIATSCNNNSKPQNTAQKEQEDKLFEQDYATVLASIDDMTHADQHLRHNLDSLQTLLDDTTGTVATGQTPKNELKKQYDSIAHEMQQLSTRNTEKVIAIIAKYGFPSSHRIKDYKGQPVTPAILLVHADLDFKDTLLRQLEKQHSYGRLDKNNLEYIKWHLNGREGIPNVTGIPVIVIDSKTGDTTYYSDGKN